MTAVSLSLIILFDLDGTLTDPKEGITRCINYALERMAREPLDTNELLFAIGPPLRASFARLLETDDPRAIELAMKYYRERFTTVGLLENAVYPGIPEVLEMLKTRDCRMLLATAKPHIYAQRILDHFNLLANFDGVFGSELDGTRQHKGDLLAHLLDREAIDTADRRTVMIGDRSHDIDAAHANGCAAMGVSWGYGSASELRHADMLCDFPMDIVNVLGKRYVRSGDWREA
ncbi:MAG: HAD hydrolase-like protein [Betaproteobacteria bacterium]|nr:HAD hydrolase-like protein [Betaproteobacteria bacterium]